MNFQRPSRQFWWQLLFWLLVTLVFLYDRRYLLWKLGLPHFAECITVRVGLLLGLAYFNTHLLWPRLWQRGRYAAYVAAVAGSLSAYLLAQGAYDTYLFGYVVGDERRQGMWLNLPYNAISTVWYLVVTMLLHLVLNRPAAPASAEPPMVLPEEPEFVWLKSGTRRVKVAVADIRYVQGLKDYSRVFTREGRYVALGSLKAMEELLPAGRFVRVHKSFLVPVSELKRFNRGQIELENVKIPVGRSYRKQVEGRLG